MAFSQSSEKEFIEKLTQITEENLTNGQFGVSELAREMGMVRTSLHRRVKSITGASASQFIRGIRLKIAMKLLRDTSLNISEVAFECGFNSVSYFSTCFHDHYGYPPGEVGKREYQEHNSNEEKDNDPNAVNSNKHLSSSFLITGFVLVIAAIVLVFIFKPFKPKHEILDKSIAVLPFANLSQDQENDYFINGIMWEILLNLQTIEDLRVPSRTSVEQYRNSSKSLPEIAIEMGVNYIVEGSGQKYGNTFKLNVQLIEAGTDDQLWGESYENEIKKPEDIFKIQSQIAQSIATELEAIITPEEKQLIEKLPTTNLNAYDFYQRGKEEHLRYWLDSDHEEALERAEDLYQYALEYDSTFALTYIGLAKVYWDKHYRESYFSENFLDSVPILVDIALSYDNQLAEAYTVRGKFYNEENLTDQAIEEFNRAIEINPNEWMAYYEKGSLYESLDQVKSIDNFHKTVSLNRGPELPELLRSLGMAYYYAGFLEKHKFYIQQAFRLDGDSMKYYESLGRVELFSNHNRAVEYLEKAYAIDSNEFYVLRGLASQFMYLGDYEKSLVYFNKWNERQGMGQWSIMSSHRIGYVYWQIGNKNEAMNYFDAQKENCKRGIELGRSYAQKSLSYYDLAGVYAFLGGKEKAYENLRIFKERKQMPLWLTNMIKIDPLFYNIRGEPEFQQIVREVEAKYQAEHERVRKWLEENGML